MKLEHRLVLEIAMGIGNGRGFSRMLRSSMNTYLHRLNCTSGTVLERSADDGEVFFEPVFSIPGRSFSRLSGIPEVSRVTELFSAEQEADFLSSLPQCIETRDGAVVYIFSLKDFGLLLLEKTDGHLSSTLLEYLLPLNRKLSCACLLCRQNDIITQENEELGRQIRQRKESEAARRSLEQRVIQRQKLESLGVLAGGIAHDFNNLLMGILCNADIALMDVEESSEAASSVQTIKKISRQAAMLCDQILLYSGEAAMKKEPLSLAEMIEGIHDLIRASVSKKVEVKYLFDSALPLISGDIVQLRQVVLNLLINASEAIGQDTGFINVSLNESSLTEEDRETFFLGKGFVPGRYVTLRISDTGCGMDRITQARIFEPFFTTKFSGRGLGLAAVLGVVRSHESFLRLESIPGEGSSFELFFPPADQERKEESPAVSVAISQGVKQAILVVDDEYIIASLVCRMLKKMGLEVWLEVSPLEAIERVKANPEGCRFAILDMKMPDMDGGELFEALRKIKPDLIGILSSGYYEADLDETYKNRGFAAFLHKPYELKELQDALLQALEQK